MLEKLFNVFQHLEAFISRLPYVSTTDVEDNAFVSRVLLLLLSLLIIFFLILFLPKYPLALKAYPALLGLSIDIWIMVVRLRYVPSLICMLIIHFYIKFKRNYQPFCQGWREPVISADNLTALIDCTISALLIFFLFISVLIWYGILGTDDYYLFGARTAYATDYKFLLLVVLDGFKALLTDIAPFYFILFLSIIISRMLHLFLFYELGEEYVINGVF